MTATHDDNLFSTRWLLQALQDLLIAFLLEHIVRQEQAILALFHEWKPIEKFWVIGLLSTIRENYSFRSERNWSLPVFYYFKGTCELLLRLLFIISFGGDCSSWTVFVSIGRFGWLLCWLVTIRIGVIENDWYLLTHNRSYDIAIVHELNGYNFVSRVEDALTQHRVDKVQQVIARVVQYHTNRW